jgi:hypothetical protein
LSQLEHGKILQPREDRLELLADALGITLWDLVTRRLPPAGSGDAPAFVDDRNETGHDTRHAEIPPARSAAAIDIAGEDDNPDSPAPRAVPAFTLGSRHYPGVVTEPGEPERHTLPTDTTDQAQALADIELAIHVLGRLPHSAHLPPDQLAVVAGFIRSGLHWLENRVQRDGG